MKFLDILITQDIPIAELVQVLSEIASYVSEDAKVNGTLHISLDELQYFTEDTSEQEHIIQEMLGTLAKYNVEVKKS